MVNKGNGTYRIERLSSDHMDSMAELFKKVFRSDFSIEYLQKKYDTSYLGISHLGYLAFKENTPVAYAGYIPYRLNFGNGDVLAAQSVDSMVVDDVRCTGVFKLLQEYNMKLLEDEGIKMIFGFANQNSEPVFKKMGWSSDQHMKVFVIKLNNIPFAKFWLKLGIKKNHYKNLEEVPGHFENPLGNSGDGYVSYDPDLFRYKSFSGARIVLINGIKVWLKITHAVNVGNVEECSREKFNEMLDELKALTRKCGLNEIIFQFSPDTNFASWLTEKYSPIKGCAIVYKLLEEDFGYKTIHFSNADIDTF
jgi:hypothetical protein